jgi:hypothetical protein
MNFILFWNNTLRVSDGLSVHQQESRTVHTSSGICTVLYSWWWTENSSETCRVLFQNKINLRYFASGWFYCRNILRCTVLQTSTKNWFPPSLDNGRSPHVYIKPEAANTVWSSWWWVVCRSKHAEPSINFGKINSIIRLHLVGYLYWTILRCTDQWILN